MKFSFEKMQTLLNEYKFKKKVVGNISEKDTDMIINIMQKFLTGNKQMISILESMNNHEKDESGKCLDFCTACRASKILNENFSQK